MATTQYKIRIEEELIQRLADLGDEFGMSGNAIAAEVLEQYLDFWIEARRAQSDVYNRQRSTALGKAPAESLQINEPIKTSPTRRRA